MLWWGWGRDSRAARIFGASYPRRNLITYIIFFSLFAGLLAVHEFLGAIFLFTNFFFVLDFPKTAMIFYLKKSRMGNLTKKMTASLRIPSTITCLIS